MRMWEGVGGGGGGGALGKKDDEDRRRRARGRKGIGEKRVERLLQ